MISVLIILFIVIMIQIFVIGLFFSNIELNIEECDISYNVDCIKRININKLKVNLKIYLFKKIKILKIKIFKNYCEIFKIKINLNVLKKLKDNKQSGFEFVIKNIREMNPKIKNINLELRIGTESTMITTFLIPTISTVVSILIIKYRESNNHLKLNDYSNYNFKIIPRYVNTNNFILKGSLQISFDTIRTLCFINKHKEIKV